MKRSSLPLNIYFKKIWQIFGFDNMWSQRSKVALGRLEQWKIYPNSKFSNIISQCYLDPGDTTYYEERLFLDEQVS